VSCELLVDFVVDLPVVPFAFGLVFGLTVDVVGCAAGGCVRATLSCATLSRETRVDAVNDEIDGGWTGAVVDA